MAMPLKVPVERLQTFYEAIFQRAGVPQADAMIIAEVQVHSALCDPYGLDHFWTARLSSLLRRLRAGGINPKPALSVGQETARSALIDGNGGMGQLVSVRAMELCLKKVKQERVALVGVRNAATLGVAAYYSMMALKEDCIGFVGTNTELKIGLAPWGGITPVLGNNPFSVAIPAGQERPVVLDMSVTATEPQPGALNQEAKRQDLLLGGFIPRPVMGGHKGYGLAVVMEILCGVLTGAGFGRDHAPEVLDNPAVRPNLGHLFMAFDIELFMPKDQFKARIDELIHQIKSAERAPGVERIFLPGELEQERKEARLKDGVPFWQDAREELEKICQEFDIESSAVFPPALF
jgi:LDH2 family malate/lactate/ureidoglycolate dehydrogenase